MASEATNIDDLLTQGTSSLTPPTPESKSDLSEGIESPYHDSQQEESHDDYDKESASTSESEESQEDNHTKESKKEQDEYGNEKPKARTYTEEEVNERINKAVRDRLARGNQQNQSINQQAQEQSKDFEYNPESSESWESQLEKFVEKTISKLSHKQSQQVQREKEVAQQAEFEEKFSRGMSKFSDFREVVSSQPVTDAMTYALRGLNDPAAFIYAASKRFPQELERISKIADPIAQVMEMGGLEKSMRKSTQSTSAPKPISKSKEDGLMPTTQKKKEPTIEDLIAASDAKRRAQLQQKRGR